MILLMLAFVSFGHAAPIRLLFYGAASGRFVHVTVRPHPSVSTPGTNYETLRHADLQIHVGQSRLMRPNRILFRRLREPLVQLELETGLRLNLAPDQSPPLLIVQNVEAQHLYTNWTARAYPEDVEYRVNDFLARTGELFSNVETQDFSPFLFQDELPPAVSLERALACEGLVTADKAP